MSRAPRNGRPSELREHFAALPVLWWIVVVPALALGVYGIVLATGAHHAGGVKLMALAGIVLGICGQVSGARWRRRR